MADTGKTITSAANPAVKRLRSLGTKKYRDEEGVFLVEGLRHVEDALAGGFALETLGYAPRASREIAAIAPRATHVLELTDDLLSRITQRDNAQSVIGAFRMKPAGLAAVTAGLWVGLEGIRDPGNLGTIIRTADAVKADGVMLIGDTCDPYAPETIRATMGSFARVPVAQASVKEFLLWRASWKGRVIGTHLRTDTDYRKADYASPLLLLMGSESNGLSDEAVKACTSLVKIPMAGGAESLNLAVSTGVMLYEICRSRL
ncbi:MAG TPA: RNA methyltransferase [Patescibacteria group bacterium]|nr:RNA methyltransferase [Patescibacteria group bacterium]